MGATIGRLHNAGAAAGRHHKAAALAGQSHGPLGKHVSQPTRVFVKASHLHAGMGAFKSCLQRVRILAAGLCFWRRWFGGARFFQDGERVLRVRQAGKSCRAKKNDCVLNFLAPETGKRLRVLRENSQNPSVRAVEKIRIQVSQWSGEEIWFIRIEVLIAFIAVCHTSLSDKFYKYGITNALTPVTIANCLHNAQPDIQQAKSRNSAANKSQLQQVLESGPLCQQAIAKPVARPGQSD